MKEVKEIENIELKNYDISVNSYLTYAQIQVIADSVKKLVGWANRNQCIDMLVLHYATNLTNEDLEAHTHDYWLRTGIIDDVKKSIKNIDMVNTAIKHEEDPIRLLVAMSNEMPEFSKQLNEAMEMAKNAPSKK